MATALDTFLRLILPWETEYQQTYKSVTWKWPAAPGWKQGDPPPFANYAAQSYSELVRLITNRIARPQNDVYVALGTQAIADATKTTKDGFVKAIRKLENINYLKSIWLDIDVGKEGAYATQQDAFGALMDFVDTIGLPNPTMIVFSGSGGMHVYWCTAEPMPQNNWRPLAVGLQQAAVAYGLKFDPLVTVNAAGILRVPTSFNWKNLAEAKPVTLLDSPHPVHSYDELMASLATYIGAAAPPLRVVKPSSWSQNFQAGVGQAPPVDIRDVAVNCPTIDDVLQRGGNGDPEPLWNMMMLVASFTDDPHAAAHALSNQDPRYTRAETEAKLAQKITDRANNPGIGWPKCTSIAPLHPACKTCPLLVQDKSPLNFANRPNSAQPGAAPQQGSDTLVPPPYWRDSKGHIHVTVKDEDDEEKRSTIDVLEHPVLEAGINVENGNLVFKTTISGTERWANVKLVGNVQPAAMGSALMASVMSGGIHLPSYKWKIARDFMVSWVKHLQQTKQVIVPATYGWTEDHKGFTFDNQTYYENSTQVAFRGTSFDKRYMKYGVLDPWTTAMDLIYGNGPLEIVAASSFAAPLTALLGNTSAVLSIYSADSGVGKTTAMRLAQAVWGDPLNGMSSYDDTPNSVKKKIADLKSLPIYWDELLSAEHLEKVVNMVFSFTQGKSKSRLTRDAQQQDTNSFITLFCVASNYGIASTVYAGTTGTEAGGLRVFEIEADKLVTTMPVWESNQIMLPLGRNYGCAGMIYAEYIASNRLLVEQLLEVVGRDLNKEHKYETKERFWAVTMTVVLTGAMLANACGLTKFDITAMKKHLGEELAKQRAQLLGKGHVTMTSPDAVLNMLSDLVSELRGKHMITTTYVPVIGMGRPAKVDLVDTDVSRLQNVWLQQGVNDERLRIRSHEFEQWLRKRNQNPSAVIRMLRKHYNVLVEKLSIGAGVALVNSQTIGAAGRSQCYDLTPIKITSSGSSPGSP